jgi:hypothetical protein
MITRHYHADPIRPETLQKLQTCQSSLYFFNPELNIGKHGFNNCNPELPSSSRKQKSFKTIILWMQVLTRHAKTRRSYLKIIDIV